MLYAEQPGVHDVMARKSVHDVVALITYPLKKREVSAGSARATCAPGTPLRRAPHVEPGVPQGAQFVREWGALA